VIKKDGMRDVEITYCVNAPDGCQLAPGGSNLIQCYESDEKDDRE